MAQTHNVQPKTHAAPAQQAAPQRSTQVKSDAVADFDALLALLLGAGAPVAVPSEAETAADKTPTDGTVVLPGDAAALITLPSTPQDTASAPVGLGAAAQGQTTPAAAAQASAATVVAQAEAPATPVVAAKADAASTAAMPRGAARAEAFSGAQTKSGGKAQHDAAADSALTAAIESSAPLSVTPAGRPEAGAARELPANAPSTAAPSSALPQLDAPKEASAAGKIELTLDSNVGSARWSGEVGEKVVILLAKREHQAELRVTPAELGPIEVKISLDQGEANVSFVALQPETRSALEAALPRLRDMLADNGISLGGFSVGAERGERRQSDARWQAAPSEDSATAEPVMVRTSAFGRASGNQLVDVFA